MNKQIQLLIESAEVWLEGDVSITDDPLCLEYLEHFDDFPCHFCPTLEFGSCLAGMAKIRRDNDYPLYGEWLNCLAESLVEKEKNNGNN